MRAGRVRENDRTTTPRTRYAYGTTVTSLGFSTLLFDGPWLGCMCAQAGPAGVGVWYARRVDWGAQRSGVRNE